MCAVFSRFIPIVLFNIYFLGSCTYIKFEVAKKNEAKMLRNTGIVKALEGDPQQKATPELIKKVFGVHADSLHTENIRMRFDEMDRRSGISYRSGDFESYDKVRIPFYEIVPPDFDSSKKYPTIILFSGHGDMEQVAFEKWTYQKGMGLVLAQQGFVVYTMENRGMGKLSQLGDHLKIDAVARLTGGSWYGELITDGLYLLEAIRQLPYIDAERIGAGGVSTGGALSMLTAALDHGIRAAYVQGYLGSYKTTFGTRSNHHICNNIPGILNYFDMDQIAASIAPRKAMFVNGKRDTFYYQDAQEAFGTVLEAYQLLRAEDNVSFEAPEGTIHELSVEIMKGFFQESL